MKWGYHHFRKPPYSGSLFVGCWLSLVVVPAVPVVVDVVVFVLLLLVKKCNIYSCI